MKENFSRPESKGTSEVGPVPSIAQMHILWVLAKQLDRVQRDTKLKLAANEMGHYDLGVLEKLLEDESTLL